MCKIITFKIKTSLSNMFSVTSVQKGGLKPKRQNKRKEHVFPNRKGRVGYDSCKAVPPIAK